MIKPNDDFEIKLDLYHYQDWSTLRYLFIILITIISFSRTHALSIQSYSLKDLWGLAQHVVIAQVSHLESDQLNQRIITHHLVEIKQTLLGDPNTKKLRFTLPGGQRAGLVQKVPGVPKVEVGQTYLFFLKCTESQKCVPIGYGQGIWKQSRTKSKRWSPLVDGVHWLGKEPSYLKGLTLEQIVQNNQKPRNKSPHHWQPNEVQP